MISLIFIVIAIFLIANISNAIQTVNVEKNELTKQTCPPHSWSWVPVYNQDGSVHHEHIVCAKCGPLHGAREHD